MKNLSNMANILKILSIILSNKTVTFRRHILVKFVLYYDTTITTLHIIKYLKNQRLPRLIYGLCSGFKTKTLVFLGKIVYIRINADTQELTKFILY